MLLPALNAARESARRATCVSNLKQLGLGIKVYANKLAWEGWYPNAGTDGAAANLKLLMLMKTSTEGGLYICPSATGYTKYTGPVNGSELADTNVSYVYARGLSESSAADSAVIADSPNNHTDAGNALFVDGHAQLFDTIDTTAWTTFIPNYSDMK